MSKSRFQRPVVLAALLVLLALVAVAAVGAPQAGGGSTATIKFRAFVDDGNPAADLKAGDVALKVEGKPREILSLKFVDLRAGGAGAEPKPAETPFSTNVVSASNRDVYILVDEESIAPGREAAVKEAATLVLGALSPADRAALVSVRQGGPNLGLTTDRERVRAAVESLAGYATTNESVMDLTCRTSRTIQALQAVFESAGGSTPPTVVFFSTGVAGLQAGKTATMGRPLGTEAELCQLRTEHYQRLGAAAENASASFFALELLDTSARPAPPEVSGGLEDLAGSTSGDFLRVGANVETQMARVARSGSGYYVATFAPESSDRSGGSKRVELTVARGGVTVKAPKELSLSPPAGKAKAKAATPRDMIRVATAFTDLPLRAAAYASRNPGDDKIRILALFEPIESDTKVKSATIAMYDTAGKLTAQWNAQSGDLAGPTGIAALLVTAGEYRLRVAATDTSGRAGAVDLKISAALIEAGPIRLGDLVLGKMSETGPVPVMQFQTETEALAMIELYGRPEAPLKMYVEVLNPAGEPIQVALAPSASNEKDKFLLSATLPIASLEPGDYTVRAVVGVEGHQEGQVTCTLRKLKAGS